MTCVVGFTCVCIFLYRTVFAVLWASLTCATGVLLSGAHPNMVQFMQYAVGLRKVLIVVSYACAVYDAINYFMNCSIKLLTPLFRLHRFIQNSIPKAT